MQEEEVWRYFQKHIETWDPTGRIIETVAEKVWKLSQSSDTEGMHMEQYWDKFPMLAQGTCMGKGLPGYGEDLDVQTVTSAQGMKKNRFEEGKLVSRPRFARKDAVVSVFLSAFVDG